MKKSAIYSPENAVVADKGGQPVIKFRGNYFLCFLNLHRNTQQHNSEDLFVYAKSRVSFPAAGHTHPTLPLQRDARAARAPVFCHHVWTMKGGSR